MDQKLKDIFREAEEDLQKLYSISLQPANKAMLAAELKKSTSKKFLEILTTMMNEAEGNEVAFYDVIKENFFDIRIEKVVVADTHIKLPGRKYHHYGTTSDTVKKILNFLESQQAFDYAGSDPNGVPKKLITINTLSRALGIEEKYCSNLLNRMKNEKKVNNYPYQGWCLSISYQSELAVKEIKEMKEFGSDLFVK